MSHREVVSRKELELLEAAIARPVGRRAVDELESFFRDVPHELTVRHVYDERPPVPVREGTRWGPLAVYVFGLVMLAVVAGLLVAAGVLDVRVPAPPWTR